MSASLVLYRHEAAGQVRVRVSNNGANDLLVRRLRVQWSGLEDVAPTEQDYPIRPGQLVALPVRYFRATVTFPGSRTPAACAAASTGYSLRLSEPHPVDGATASESVRTCMICG